MILVHFVRWVIATSPYVAPMLFLLIAALAVLTWLLAPDALDVVDDWARRADRALHPTRVWLAVFVGRHLGRGDADQTAGLGILRDPVVVEQAGPGPAPVGFLPTPDDDEGGEAEVDPLTDPTIPIDPVDPPEFMALAPQLPYLDPAEVASDVTIGFRPLREAYVEELIRAKAA